MLSVTTVLRKLILFFGINVLMIFSVSAQTNDKVLVDSLLLKASNFYDNFKNQEAVDVYLEIFGIDPVNPQAKLGIAESYFAMNDYHSSEMWYHVALEDGLELQDDNYYEYGLSLISNKKYHKAEALFSEYDKSGEEPLTEKIMSALNNIHKYLKDSNRVKVTNLSINSDKADFYPNYHNEGIVFISSRIEEDNFQPLNLYFSKEKNTEFESPDQIMNSVNQKFHVGHKVYFEENNKILYVLNKGKSEGESGFPPMDLYQAHGTAKLHRWKKPKSLPVNSKGYANFQPTISKDGKVIYFISDRPGGFGGTDIYVTRLVDGSWSTPENLGEKVNSTGNELYPFLLNDDVLYYSSDALEGLGGLDLFEIPVSQIGTLAPRNLGFPFNSAYDDFALITKDGIEGMFSSNRLGGVGEDDIYHFSIVDAPTNEIVSAVIEAKTSKSTEASNVTLYTREEEREINVDETSNLDFNLPTGTAYALISEDGKKSCLSAGLAGSEHHGNAPMLCQEIKEGQERVHVVGFAIDQLTKAPLANVDFEVLDKETLAAINFDANNSVVTFIADKQKEYLIKINEYGYQPYEHTLVASPTLGDNVMRTDFGLSKNIVKLNYMAKILDAETSEPLENAIVELSTAKEDNVSYSTDSEGNVSYKMFPDDHYLVMITDDNHSSIFTGIASMDDTEDQLVYLVDAMGKDENVNDYLQIAGFITDNETGSPLIESQIIVLEKESREIIEFKQSNGVLTFQALKGKLYSIVVDRFGYKTEEFEIDTNDSEDKRLAKFNFGLTKFNEQLSFAAHIYDDATLENIEEAEMVVSSFKKQDKTYKSNDKGIAEFTLDPDEPYILFVTKNNMSAMYSGTAHERESKAMMMHEVALINTEDGNTVTVAGIIADNNTGKPLDQADITVKEKESQEYIDYTYVGGVLSFQGEKGKSYDMTIENSGYETTNIAINADLESMPGLVKFNGGMVKVTSEITYKVRSIDDDTANPLANSEIKISAFNSPDIVLHSDNEGNFEFKLKPEDTYLILANFQDKSGMLFGTASSSESSYYKTHEVRMSETDATNNNENLVVGMVGDATTGEMISDFALSVTSKPTGQTINTKIDGSLFMFTLGDSSNFTINISKDGYKNTSKDFSTLDLGNDKIGKFDLALQPVGVAIPGVFSGENFGVERQLLVMKNVSDKNQLWEVTTSEIIDVTESPSYSMVNDLIRKHAIPVNTTSLDKVLSDNKATFVLIHNVFFDFNKYGISDEGKSELNSLISIMNAFPDIQLEIRSHTDSRGSQKYNEGLSSKRSASVKKYLIGKGLEKSRIITTNLGENGLVNNCDDGVKCNEAAHSKNRRTEFILHRK